MRRQHGTRDVQHGVGSEATAVRRKHFLLFRLQLPRTQSLQRESLAVLLRHAAASSRRLSHQLLFLRSPRPVRQFVPPVYAAMEARWQAGFPDTEALGSV